MKEKRLIHRGAEVYYTDQGRGACIVLLHGYLETWEIWKDFAASLAGNFRVISMDLPGHGRSGRWGEEHSMEDLAGSVKAVCEAEEIDRIGLVGHSMGGYVTMAFAELYPDLLWGYALFHSTCFADTDEKRVNRDREISLVLCGKKLQIVNVSIPKAFADDNTERLKKEVSFAQDIALQCEDQGIVAILNGMKSRPDRSHVLSNPALPLLLIGGMKDNYIPVEVFEELVALAPHARVLRLEESGHMGFIEEPEN
ncbi:MAG: alpha/beta hydrolase, partial [Bacteroidota bacterium]